MVLDRQADGQMEGKVGAPTKKSIFRRECNSPWDEKKKRIINQIFLSYIGQIYTIPKFIEEAIEKTITQLSI